MASVLYCHCAYRDFVPPEVRHDVLKAIADTGVSLTAVPDLCELVARRDAALRDAVGKELPIVVACRPRAVRWLLHELGVEPGEGLRVLDMRALPPAEIVSAIAGLAAETGAASAAPPVVERRGDWVPWFPVIDRSRCINCKQCVSFCAFGVYSVRDGERVQVTAPENCKNNCPACARICPRLAIIFPKCRESPIDGAEVTEADVRVRQARIAEQLRDMAGGDLRAALAKRRAAQAAAAGRKDPPAQPGGPAAAGAELT